MQNRERAAPLRVHCEPKEIAMKARQALIGFFVSAALALPTGTPRASGIPVIDVAAIVQLLQQITYWQQQIQGMVNQLNQLRAHYQAITGSRGMQGLLPYTNLARNYLPPDYQEMLNAANNASGSYSALASQIRAAVNANAVLNNGQLAVLSQTERAIIEDGRRAAGTIQATTRAALQSTSQRFAALQQLIGAIATAGDDKAIQDLQGRISVEQAMLQNEQTKLQTLYQIAQADQWANEQRVREQVVNSTGTFDARRRLVSP
jgi:type IV secretion system protein VirB5